MLVVNGLPNLTGSVTRVRKRTVTIVSLSKVPTAAALGQILIY
jgi:hypothetical protein